MLQRIREGAQGWIAWTILILITVAFVLWGLQYYIHRGRSIQPLAKINSETIFQSDWETAFNRAKRQQLIARKRVTLTAAEEKQLKKAVLRQMIRDYVTRVAYTHAGFKVGDPQVQRVMMSLPALQKEGVFSEQLWQRMMSQMRLTPQQFMSEIRYDILENQVQAGMLLSAFALPQEAQTAIELLQQKRDVEYLIFHKLHFKPKKKPSQLVLQQTYEKYTKQWMLPEQVKVQYLRLTSDNFLKNHTISEQHLKDFYENNKAQFAFPAQWQLAHILIKIPSKEDEGKAQQQADAVFQKLKKGEQFAMLAKKYSDDVLSSKQGGDLGWVKDDLLDPVLQKTVKTLKPGEFSKPIRSKYGYGILKLLAMKAEGIWPYEAVKNQVKQAVVTEKMEQWFAQKSEELSDLVYANPNTLSVASEQLGLPIQETPFIRREGNYTGLMRNEQVREAVFSPEVLRDGYNSAPIEMGSHSLLVVRVKRHVKPRRVKYAEVKDRVFALYQEEQARKNARAAAKVVAKKIAQGRSLAAIAKDLKLPLKQVRGVTRYQSQKTLETDLRRAIFSLPYPNKGKAFAAKLVALKNGDVALVTVKTVKAGAFSKDKINESQAFREELANRLGSEDYNLYVKALMKQAKIKILVPVETLAVRR